MKHARVIAVLGLITSLVACASNPAQDHYYSLVLASDSIPMTITDNKAVTRMLVGPIRLARYLDQPGLPIQTSASQIQSANHHLWAEALDEAIAKVLVRDIERRIDGVAVERDAGRWTPEARCRVRVEFDKFHATHDSKVVTAGRYWIHRGDAADSARQEFAITRVLSKDGYAHAVRELRASLDALATDIAAYVQPACGPAT